MSQASAGPGGEGEPDADLNADPGGAAEGEEPLVIVRSCGNVFADLLLPEPEQLQTKAGLSIEANAIIKARGLTRAQAAALLGLTPAEVTQLGRHKLGAFPVWRLMEVLTRLGRDVEVIIRPRREARDEDDEAQQGQVSVHVLR